MITQQPRIPLKDIILYGLLPSFLKTIIYRLKGYKIGRNVSIGFGSVVCGQDVSIGDNARIGFMTIIRGKKIAIGRYVSIGATVFLDTPHIEIGDGTKINEQVFVGGLQFPDSRFSTGRNCQIMQMTFINPAKSITLGDDTGIGGHCLLFGHTSWLSCFEGYPVEFKPIEIGNSVSIAWGAFLLPGTIIGDGAVIGANSMVSRTVPPKCLAIGYPARIVSKYPDFPKEVNENEKEVMLRDILENMIQFFEGSGLECLKQQDTYSVTYIKKRLLFRQQRTEKLKVHYTDFGNELTGDAGLDIDVLVSLKKIPVHIRKDLVSHHVMWIDIENKEQSEFSNELGEDVVQFLRRYGVRFFRVN